MRAKYEMLDNVPHLSATAKPQLSTQPMNVSHTLRRFTYRNHVPLGEMYMGGDSNSDGSEDAEYIPMADIASNPTLRSLHVDPVRMNTEEPGYYAHAPIFASGRVLAGDMLDGLVFESFRTPGIVEVIKLMSGRRYQKWIETNEHLGITGSAMMSIPLPAGFIVSHLSQGHNSFDNEHCFNNNEVPHVDLILGPSVFHRVSSLGYSSWHCSDCNLSTSYDL
jgi:hypothetical protein